MQRYGITRIPQNAENDNFLLLLLLQRVAIRNNSVGRQWQVLCLNYFYIFILLKSEMNCRGSSTLDVFFFCSFHFLFLDFHHSTILLKREIPKCQVVRGVAVAQVSSHKTKLLEQKISRTYDIIFVLALLHTQQVYRNSIKKSLIGR